MVSLVFLDLISLLFYGSPSNTFNNISLEIFKAEVVYSFFIIIQFFLFTFRFLPLRYFSIYCVQYVPIHLCMHTCICIFICTRIPLCMRVWVYALCYMLAYIRCSNHDSNYGLVGDRYTYSKYIKSKTLAAPQHTLASFGVRVGVDR